jgi:hypothetical protein
MLCCRHAGTYARSVMQGLQCSRPGLQCQALAACGTILAACGPAALALTATACQHTSQRCGSAGGGKAWQSCAPASTGAPRSATACAAQPAAHMPSVSVTIALPRASLAGWRTQRTSSLNVCCTQSSASATLPCSRPLSAPRTPLPPSLLSSTAHHAPSPTLLAHAGAWAVGQQGYRLENSSSEQTAAASRSSGGSSGGSSRPHRFPIPLTLPPSPPMRFGTASSGHLSRTSARDTLLILACFARSLILATSACQ